MSGDIIRGDLPNVLKMNDGSIVENPADWQKRRKEILDTVIDLEYGGMPPEPTVFRVEPLHLPGKDRLNSYKIFAGTEKATVSFLLQLYLPDRDDPCPVVLTGDGCYATCKDTVIEEAKSRGFAVAKFNRTELAADKYDGKRDNGLFTVYPELAFSSISAWAWGYLRAVDALCGLSCVDNGNIAVTGHSRGGKTVLLAAACDERIRYCNPNDSGAHGCGNYRYEQNEKNGKEDKRSELLADLMKNVPIWLGEGMREYIGRETELPHDMHFMKALIAPRVFIETEARGDIWANPKGSFQTFLAAKPVFELLGAGRNMLLNYREGLHSHKPEDFCVLTEIMACFISNKPIPDKYYLNPYPDMEQMKIKP